MRILFAVFLSSLLYSLVEGLPKLNPVVLVPGDGGSQLQAKLNKTTTVSYVCEAKTNYYFDLWLNIELLLPFVIDCFVDNMRLEYDNKTRTTLNSPGVDIRVPGFGGTETVEYLDHSELSLTSHRYCSTHSVEVVDILEKNKAELQKLPLPRAVFLEGVKRVQYQCIIWKTSSVINPDKPMPYNYATYYHNIVVALEHLGYQRNKTIRGAPFDFRKAPNELGEYIKALQALVEETYYQNFNTPVVLLGHSMGNPLTLYLLNHMSQQWKDKFIKSFISLAGVWGGAMKPIRLMVSGDNLNVPIVKSINVRREQRSMPSTAWLMPSDEFWSPDEVLVVSPEKNYTMKDIKQLFTDIDYMTGYMMWEDTRSLINPLKAPGVEMHCLHGINVPETPGQFIYDNKTWHEGSPVTVPDNGDGTVNLRSLAGCLRFRKQQKQPVFHKVFDKAEHMQILNRNDVIDEIMKILMYPHKS